MYIVITSPQWYEGRKKFAPFREGATATVCGALRLTLMSNVIITHLLIFVNISRRVRKKGVAQILPWATLCLFKFSLSFLGEATLCTLS